MEAKRLHEEQQQFIAARAAHSVPLMSHQFGGLDQRSYSPPPSHDWTGPGPSGHVPQQPHPSPLHYQQQHQHQQHQHQHQPYSPPAPAPPKNRFAHLVNSSDEPEAGGEVGARSVDSHTDLRIHKLSLRRDQVRSLSSTLQSLSQSLA
jgi:hypothetical protein